MSDDQHDDMTEDELEASLLADEQAAAAAQTTAVAHPSSVIPGPCGTTSSASRPLSSNSVPLRHRGVVHAYLFVGPSGSTKLEAARAFASQVMSGGEDRDQRDARLILRGEHPDVREVQRTGPSISADQAREIVRVASLAPVGRRHARC